MGMRTSSGASGTIALSDDGKNVGGRITHGRKLPKWNSHVVLVDYFTSVLVLPYHTRIGMG
eukprot:scaffold10650_cov169-Amphora_coffeaeformis.AAC.1